MKSLGGSGEMVTNGAITAGGRSALRHELAGGGHDQRHEFAGRAASESGDRARLPADERGGDASVARALQARRVGDGRYELFKTTKKYDGDVGREQHGFPSAKELPA